MNNSQINKLSLLIVTYFLFVAAICAQNELAYTESEKQCIKMIDGFKFAINNNWNSLEKKMSYNDSTDYRYFYTRNKELQIISIHLEDKSKTCSYVQELYFDKGQIILVEQITTLKAFNKVVETEQMYFKNDLLFLWIKSGLKIDPLSSEFKKTADDMLLYVKKNSSD